MTHAEQKQEFEKLIRRAQRAGLLKAHLENEGIAIIELPPPVAEPPPFVAPPSGAK